MTLERGIDGRVGVTLHEMGAWSFIRGVTWRVLSLLPLPLLLGCAAMRPARTPIPRATHVSDGGAHQTLMVLLPGIRDTRDDFERHGFIAAVRERDLPVDLVAVDAHFGYYTKRTLIERLLADVIVPAREDGYDRVILVGVSLGGLGALITAREAPDQVDGIVLIAPFLGEKKFISEIEAAG